MSALIDLNPDRDSPEGERLEVLGTLVQAYEAEHMPITAPLTVQAPPRPRYKLADLMAEMPQGLPRVEGWDEMLPVGLENR